MASILKNLAPPFDSGKTYKYGDRFVTGGHMYQVLEPFSGELDMNKLVEVTIADLVKGGYPPYDSFAGELVEAASVTSDEQNTYFGVPKSGFYNEESKIFTPNSNLGSKCVASFTRINGIALFFIYDKISNTVSSNNSDYMTSGYDNTNAIFTFKVPCKITVIKDINGTPSIVYKDKIVSENEQVLVPHSNSGLVTVVVE